LVKSTDELPELQQTIDRLEQAAFDGRRALAANTDLRENLLLDDHASVDAFARLNAERDAAQAKIDRAARLLPELKQRLAELHTERRKIRGQEFKKQLEGAARKIDVALLALVAANQEARGILQQAHEELGATCESQHGLLDLSFHGMMTPQGVADWKAFIDRNFYCKGQEYREPPPKPKSFLQTSKPTPMPNERGLFGVAFLTRSGRYQAGDKVSLPEADAKALVEKGQADFIDYNRVL
jgi:hypothetical protein